MAAFHELAACWIESTAVVLHAQLHLRELEFEGHFNLRRVRMFERIGDGFFADAQQILFEDALKFAFGTLNGEDQRYGCAFQRPFARSDQRLRKIPTALARG